MIYESYNLQKNLQSSEYFDGKGLYKVSEIFAKYQTFLTL